MGSSRALAMAVLLSLASASGLRWRPAQAPQSPAPFQQSASKTIRVVLLATALLAPTGTGAVSRAEEAPRTGVTRRELLEEEAAKPQPAVIPFTGAARDFGRAPRSAEVQLARRKIIALKPYLDEIERYVYQEDYKPLRAFLNVFTEQEDSFIKTIDSAAAQKTDTALAAADAMEHEAKEVFLALDDIRKAATLQKPVSCKKGYIKLALAYDRYLKASDNLPMGYDKVVSTENYYAEIPDAWLSYDISPPKVRDAVLFIAGPDKGRTGVLLGFKTKVKTEAVVETEGAMPTSKPFSLFGGKKGDDTEPLRTAVVKMDNYLSSPRLSAGEQAYTEVKEVPSNFVARQLDPDD